MRELAMEADRSGPAEGRRCRLKDNEAEARERLRAFWAGESLGRPAVAVKSPRHDKPIELPERAGPEPTPAARDRDVAWQARSIAEGITAWHCHAEAMPYGMPRIGSHLTLVAEQAGASVGYATGSTWIESVDEDFLAGDPPRFDPHHERLGFAERVMSEAAASVGDLGIVGPPSQIDAMTTLSEMRTADLFCLDLIERPEAVGRWVEALTAIYNATYEQLYRHAVSLGYGDTRAWLGALAEGRMEAVQCDIAVMLSPEMFGQFVMPALRTMTEYLDFSLYHLDGVAQMRFLDQLATLPHLNGIQWNPEPPAGPVLSHMEHLRAIREKNLALHIWCKPEEAAAITRELGPDGLFFDLDEKATAAEAEAAVEQIRAAC